mmetsp:Transcript_49175/g.111543  ORF Transcript_49175/g.111543 Transcript_49175/m.111543 type:complete len:304 (+) Transcript_49175:335-1246(+)
MSRRRKTGVLVAPSGCPQSFFTCGTGPLSAVAVKKMSSGPSSRPLVSAACSAATPSSAVLAEALTASSQPSQRTMSAGFSFTSKPLHSTVAESSSLGFGAHGNVVAASGDPAPPRALLLMTRPSGSMVMSEGIPSTSNRALSFDFSSRFENGKASHGISSWYELNWVSSLSDEMKTNSKSSRPLAFMSLYTLARTGVKPWQGGHQWALKYRAKVFPARAAFPTLSPPGPRKVSPNSSCTDLGRHGKLAPAGSLVTAVRPSLTMVLPSSSTTTNMGMPRQPNFFDRAPFFSRSEKGKASQGISP